MPRRSTSQSTFASRLIAWHASHGRHDLPWQNTRDPYRIWVSEIMLQQTQVSTVIPYYERFMSRFADVRALAEAPQDEVMAHWAGLGYYARARNLQRAAQVICEAQGGEFPSTREAIEALPGIGRSTAAAIAAFAFGEREAILDGNVKRVLARVFGIEGFPGERAVEQEMWALAESLLPDPEQIGTYIQAQMDLGATLCTRGKPRCADCPLSGDCVAFRTGRVELLPTARPARAIPHRESAMLILRAGPEVLLEKRPPSGIWGGLWCFPEFEPEADAAALANIRFGVTVAAVSSLAPVQHGFTHYSLTLYPRVVEVKKRPKKVAEAGQLWISVEEALEAAIPKPVKLMLEALLTPPLFAAPEERAAKRAAPSKR